MVWIELLTSLLRACATLWVGWLFFAGHFKAQRDRIHILRFMIAAGVMMMLYGALALDPVSPYLLRGLALAVMLLYVFREAGRRALLLLTLAATLLLSLDLGITWAVQTFAHESPYPLSSLLLAGVLMLLPCVAIHFAIRTAEKNAVQETDMLLQRQHMEMQTESINALEQNYRLQRKSAHEFEHHLQVLHDLLEQEEVSEAKAYIARLQGSRSYRVISVNSRHTVIDVILNQKYQAALESGVTMQIKVNDLSQVTLPTDTLVVILSNLLENAIESCRRIDGYREITCTVLYDEGLYIAIANTSDPVDDLSTTKADTLRHGYGISNVCMLLDKLQAEYTFTYEDGWFRFAAEILE